MITEVIIAVIMIKIKKVITLVCIILQIEINQKGLQSPLIGGLNLINH